MPYDQPFAADDGLPDFDPRLATHNPMRKHMEQAAQENPFALGQAAYQPPKALLEKPNWMPTPWSQPISETLNPAEQVAGIGTGLTNAAAAAYHGNLMDSAKELAPLALGMTMPMAPKGRVLAPRIEGRYSVAEEAALNAQRKQGNAQAWTSELTKGGAKPAELEAMQWQQFLKDNPNPSRDQVIAHLQENRPQLKTTNFGQTPVIGQKDFEAYRQAHGLTEQDRLTFDQIGEWRGDPEIAGPIKWKRHNGQNLLLDPENPSNRETVLHQPVPKAVQERLDAVLTEMKAIEEAPRTPKNQLSDESGWLRLANERDKLQKDLRGTYQEAHFQQVPNYLSHLRTGIYNDEQGRPTYHIDELQSTRAQKVAEQGGPRDEAKIAELQKRAQESSAKLEAIHDQAYQHLKDRAAAQGVPEIIDQITGGYNAPGRNYQVRNMLSGTAGEHAGAAQKLLADIKQHQQNFDLHQAEFEAARAGPSGHPWVNDERTAYLNTAREAIRQATQHSGVAGISLTPGSLQNERYSLEHHIQALDYKPNGDGTYRVSYQHKGRGHMLGEAMTPQQLEANVGKDIAERIVGGHGKKVNYGGNNEPPDHWTSLQGLDLKTGGKGMRDWYDTRYPALMRQELERLHALGGGEKGTWPGQGQVNLDYDAGRRVVPGTTNKFEDAPKTPMHYFPLTDQIREAVKKGLPFFSLMALLRQQKQEQQPQLEQGAPFGYEQ